MADIQQLLEHLQHELQLARTETATLKADMKSEVTALQSQIIQMSNQMNTLQTGLLTKKAEHRPKPYLPDPKDPLRDAIQWDTWLPGVKAKLEIDTPSLGPPVAQFWYIFNNLLDPKVKAMVLLLANNKSVTPTPDLLFESLGRVFDNPNKASQAAEKLQRIRQGDQESISAYLARYERLLYEADATAWPDMAKVSTLRTGLNDTMKRKLDVQLSTPTEYDPFIRALHQLSGARYGGTSSSPLSTQSHGNTHTPMEIGSISVID